MRVRCHERILSDKHTGMSILHGSRTREQEAAGAVVASTAHVYSSACRSLRSPHEPKWAVSVAPICHGCSIILMYVPI
jgi:hypothetical protein